MNHFREFRFTACVSRAQLIELIRLDAWTCWLELTFFKMKMRLAWKEAEMNTINTPKKAIKKIRDTKRQSGYSSIFNAHMTRKHFKFVSTLTFSVHSFISLALIFLMKWSNERVSFYFMNFFSGGKYKQKLINPSIFHWISWVFNWILCQTPNKSHE